MPKLTDALAPLLLLTATTVLPGCILFIPGGEPVDRNSAPRIVAAGTGWSCGWDEGANDYAFEFAAQVVDSDGADDVFDVVVEVFPSGSGSALEAFGLLEEGPGSWGGRVLESESALRCGDAYDVRFEATDTDGAGDVLMISPSPPLIDATETGWACDYYPDRGDYAFEFVTAVDDADGPLDVREVLVTVFLADRDIVLDSFFLNYEANGIWGGIVDESDSDMLCGDPLDVQFEAWDSAGLSDVLFLPYF